MEKKQRLNLRNIAIIAHVDHGKTTLVDKLLSNQEPLPQLDQLNALWTPMSLEQERGITILAKNTGICIRRLRH